MAKWGIYIVLSLIWGGSFKLMKVGMEALSPYQVASLRMISAGIILLPFALTAVRKIPKNQILMVIASGLLGSFFPAFLFCIAETRIDSSLAGILNALTPLFTVLIGVAFFKIEVSRQKYIGVIIGFIGLALLFIARGNITFSYLSYAFLVLLATIFYGVNVNVIGSYMNNLGSLNIASLAFGFLIFPSALVLWYTGYFNYELLSKEILIATGASVVLGIFGTAIASVLFYVLVKRAGGLFASTVTYGIPFVAVFLGLMTGEYITLLQVACLAIILSGVYLANKPSGKVKTLD
jgi:drug/metabolite transporter (DMT)-like permease